MTTHERNAEIVACYKRGEPLRAIGGRYGVSREGVVYIARRAGCARRGKNTAAPDVAVRCPRCGKVSMRRPYAAGKGFCRGHYFHEKHDPAVLLEQLRALALRLGHTPGTLEINAEPGMWHMSYVNHFGSVCEAQRLAGLLPNARGGAGHIENRQERVA